jgi:hypothetical protein
MLPLKLHFGRIFHERPRIMSILKLIDSIILQMLREVRGCRATPVIHFHPTKTTFSSQFNHFDPWNYMYGLDIYRFNYLEKCIVVDPKGKQQFYIGG